MNAEYVPQSGKKKSLSEKFRIRIWGIEIARIRIRYFLGRNKRKASFMFSVLIHYTYQVFLEGRIRAIFGGRIQFIPTQIRQPHYGAVNEQFANNNFD